MMPAKPSVELTLEETADKGFLLKTCGPIFLADMVKQTPPVPAYQETLVARVAKTADGRVAGGILGKVLWNTFEVLQLAVNPACRVAGTKTALMKWAEEAARGEYACNQIFIGTYSWQPQEFFEGLGYVLQWTHENCPRGYAKHYMEKVWSMEKRNEPVQGYANAAAGLALEEWEAEEACEQLLDWAEKYRQQRGATSVPPYAKETHAMKALLLDGTLAACCLYTVTWKVLHVDILVVVSGKQRRGVGTAMLQKIDDLARQHHCHDVYLETMSWQARPFYEKNGYTHVATQQDFPMGHKRFILLRHVPPMPSSRL
ncbi:acetyltransferase [Leptomonas seymouri]|uniref:Acetyltransferase n=1 Tax=Leptomonas seymouri TaxID=5684 RepID=A0A0N1IKY8_LEPSE|nr:acetyltransferase [Leptomonas seymouri]|eukprot:KPI87411.1 acetyltransferase [Leptomonas seymouri]